MHLDGLVGPSGALRGTSPSGLVGKQSAPNFRNFLTESMLYCSGCFCWDLAPSVGVSVGVDVGAKIPGLLAGYPYFCVLDSPVQGSLWRINQSFFNIFHNFGSISERRYRFRYFRQSIWSGSDEPRLYGRNYLEKARFLPLSFVLGAVVPAVVGMAPTWLGPKARSDT